MAKIDFSEVVEKVDLDEGVELSDEVKDRLDTVSEGLVILDKKEPVSIPQVKYLRGEKGLTFEQIGKILNVTRQAIHYICQTRNITCEGIKNYRTARKSNWEHTEEQLLDLTPAQIKDMKPYERLKGGGIAADKVQILSGEPTQIISYMDMAELLKQIKAEEAKLGGDVIDVTPDEDDEADVPNTP